MNSIEENEFAVLDQTVVLRDQLMELLTDDDLKFALPGNPSLGVICREHGDAEQAYIESFKTFKMDFSYTHDDDSVESNVDQLRSWYAKLNQDLKATLSAMSQDDVDDTIVDRIFFKVPVRVQFHIYREGLLIFYAKASVYLKALGKELPADWKQWIG